MRNPNDAILGIDLGTSSAKSIVVTHEGRVLGRGQASYPTLHPREGYDEQMPDDWLQAIISAVASARRFAPAAAIQAIAITGQMHGTVALDAHGQPVHPAIIWSDRRAASMVSDIEARLGPDLPRMIGGPIGTGYQSLSLAWLLEHRPQLRESIAHALLPVDYVGYALTGRLVTDPSNAVSSGLVCAETSEWHLDLLDTFGVHPEWLPEIVPSGSLIGELTESMAQDLDLLPGLPVIHGGGDAAAAAIGGNTITHEHAMITLSTGAQVMRPTDDYTPEVAGRWHTWPSAVPHDATGSRWIHVGATLNAGRAVEWIHRTLAPGAPLGDLIALAQTAPAGSGGLLFLPYLAGERSPYLDPYARGAFIGLSDTHHSQHLVRAVIEGIALSLTDMLERMVPERARPSQIVFGGGGSSPEVRQIMANVIGVPLAIPPSQESSAVGAVRLAAHWLGWAPLNGEPWGQQSNVVVQPIAADHDLYHERLAIFRDAAAHSMTIAHRLQHLDG